MGITQYFYYYKQTEVSYPFLLAWVYLRSGKHSLNPGLTGVVSTGGERPYQRVIIAPITHQDSWMWKQNLVLLIDCERADKDFLKIIYR